MRRSISGPSTAMPSTFVAKAFVPSFVMRDRFVAATVVIDGTAMRTVSNTEAAATERFSFTTRRDM